MVSSGKILSDSSSFEQVGNKYSNQIDNTSSSWKGASHDNLVNKASEFSSEMKQVTAGMNSFADAAKLYESYKDIKSKRDSYSSKINSTTDESVKSQYKSYISDCESKMAKYRIQINEALSKASSYKMASASVSTVSTSAISTEAASTTTSGVPTTGGTFVADNLKGVYGHIKIDGKTFTIYRQSEINGWGQCCNRAAAASIASAYENSEWEAVKIAQKSSGGLGYSSNVTEKYFSNFGLTSNVTVVKGKYEKVKDDLVETLSNGSYVMFDLSEPNVKGKSGQKWTSSRHWLSVLDIKKTGDGPNDYAIFISDSGHKGSTVDRCGLGTGWYSLNEFDGQMVKNFTTVSPKTSKA